MEAFGIARPDGMECRHLDGNPTNNALSNLAWGTRQQNIMDYIQKNGKHMGKRATPVEVARKIKQDYDGSHGIGRRLAKKYGVHECVVSGIITGACFKYL